MTLMLQHLGAVPGKGMSQTLAKATTPNRCNMTSYLTPYSCFFIPDFPVIQHDRLVVSVMGVVYLFSLYLSHVQMPVSSRQTM